MTRPNNADHRAYYDGHHHEYNFGFLLCVDDQGVCRYFNGHLPGSQNDINNYYSSDMYHNPGLYYGPGDKALADGIFARIAEGRFIVPVCGVRRDLNQMEENYNRIQRQSRSIIEHYNSRLKLGCPIIDGYTYAVDSINPIFLSCVALTNIRVKFQDPLRR